MVLILQVFVNAYIVPIADITTVNKKAIPRGTNGNYLNLPKFYPVFPKIFNNVIATFHL